MRTTYIYPEDVIIENVDGKRYARLGYNENITSDFKSMIFESEMDIVLTEDEVFEFTNAYLKMWFKGRERFREIKREKFLGKIPSVIEHRKRMAEYLEDGGDKYSISGFRQWEKNKYSNCV